MKKTRSSDKPMVEAEPMPETDFSKGVRGKYYKKYRASAVTVRIDGGGPARVTKAPRRASRVRKAKTGQPPVVKAEDIPEVDFSKGVRGKHYKQYLASMVTVQLHPDVAEHFPDSTAANEGLRELLRLRGVR